jgi:hypothetical protein
MVTFPIETHEQRAVLGVAFTFSILAVLAVCLRLLAHAIAHKKWTASDYFIIVACVRHQPYLYLHLQPHPAKLTNIHRSSASASNQ